MDTENIISKIQVVDNFFPILLQKQLVKNFILTPNVAYNYQPTISYNRDGKMDMSKLWGKNNKIQDTEAFTIAIDEKHPEQTFLQDNIRHYANEKFGIQIEKFLRIMVAYLPSNPNYKDDHILPPHIDRVTPHKSILYYIDDNDAETLFFDYYYKGDRKIDLRQLNVIKSVKPVRGRAIFFDGYILHSGGVSKTNKRLTINVNFV